VLNALPAHPEPDIPDLMPGDDAWWVDRVS